MFHEYQRSESSTLRGSLNEFQSSLGKNQYKNSKNDCLIFVSFLKSRQGRPFLLYEFKLNYNYMCTMNPYKILQVKNSFVN